MVITVRAKSKRCRCCGVWRQGHWDIKH